MLDYGIKVHYDGKQNIVLYPPDWEVDCKIGEMLLDVYDTDEQLISNAVEQIVKVDEVLSEKTVFAFSSRIMDQMDAIYSPIIKLAFQNYFLESYYVSLSKENPESERLELISDLLRISLSGFLEELDDFKFFFRGIVADMNGSMLEDDKECIKALRDILRDRHTVQNIRYEIITDPYTNKFMSVYTISNLLSLLAFEYCHMQENSVVIKICKNCGNYFIPEKRTDTIYCPRKSPQDVLRTCKEIGAQIAMQNKMKEDESEKAYRKKYQSLNMAYQREQNEENKQYFYDRRTKYVLDGKSKKKELRDGVITSIDFIKWCERYS